MSHTRHEWSLTLTLEAPFASTGVENVAHGIDRAFLRNEHGEIVLSGHQIRGLFRHFLVAVIEAENAAGITADDERLVPLDYFFNWFGRPGMQLGSEEGDPHIYKRLRAESMSPARGDAVASGDGRGRLTIRDLVLQENVAPQDAPPHRTRIRVDAERKSVKHGMLLVCEQYHRTGEEVVFCSRHRGEDEDFPGVILYACNDKEKECFEQAFKLFLENLPEIGAMKSAGYGRIKGFIFKHKKSRELTIPNKPNADLNGNAFTLTLRFSDPLLVEPRLASGNVQESAQYVSGAVLKAAIAEFGRLAKDDFDAEYGDVLTKMIIRFARPASERGYRPRTIPFSLVVDEKENFRDFFDTKENERVIFPVNFKSKQWEDAARKYDQPAPSWVSQTRTAIELGEQFVAEGQLFNYRLAGVKDRRWIAEILLPDGMSDEDKEKARQLIAFLTSGVVQIGRTRSDLSGGVENHVDSDFSRCNGVWRIVLQTPAALLDDDAIKRLRTGALNLRDAYIEYFERALGKAANAIDWEGFTFLAQHRLAGGHRAAAARRRAGKAYYPFLLTEEGSIFILPEKDGAGNNDLEQILRAWARGGLPTHDANWQHNPYQPQNGYGEVRIDDIDREKLRN